MQSGSATRPHRTGAQLGAEFLHRTHLLQHRLQICSANPLLKLALQAIEDAYDSNRLLSSLRSKGKPKGARVIRIDFAFHQSLRLERRDAMAHIAASRLKCLGQMRRLDRTLFLEKDRRQDQRFDRRQLFAFQNHVQRNAHLPGDPIDLKDRALLQKGFNAHLASVYDLPNLLFIRVLNYVPSFTVRPDNH